MSSTVLVSCNNLRAISYDLRKNERVPREVLAVQIDRIVQTLLGDECQGSSIPLTKRQANILQFIGNFQKAHGYSPSYQEIADFFKYRSQATVHEHLGHLEAKGYICRMKNCARGVTLTEKPQ